MFTPLPEAAPTSAGFARRLDMPICAVPSMIAAMPVVEPSAAMSKVVPGCCALNCSASCGTSFAPSVSEPLMTNFSARASVETNASATAKARCVIFMGVCLWISANELELHVQVGLKDLIFSERVNCKGIAHAARSEIVIDLRAVGVSEVENDS